LTHSFPGIAPGLSGFLSQLNGQLCKVEAGDVGQFDDRNIQGE
jgi:hypothetical protein